MNYLIVILFLGISLSFESKLLAKEITRKPSNFSGCIAKKFKNDEVLNEVSIQSPSVLYHYDSQNLIEISKDKTKEDSDLKIIYTSYVSSDDKDSYLEISMNCDQYLSCLAKKKSIYQKKTTSVTNLKLIPTSYGASVYYAGRNVFDYYRNSDNSFNVKFVAIKNKNYIEGVDFECN